MLYWIYDLQTWTMVFGFCAFFVGVTWFGTIFIRPFLRAFVRRQSGLNDILGYLLGALVLDEATKLASLYRDVAAYPEPSREELTSKLRTYARFVIDEAWPDQK